MRTDGVLRILNSIPAVLTDVEVSVGMRGEDAAYLRLSHPQRWAVVQSPGDRWFSLDIDGGFSLDYFEEETPDDEAEAILRTYVDLAVAYMRHEKRRTVTRWLRRPRVVISTGGVEYVLRPPAFG